VTLSGCATGMNSVADGDELLGLQRGLFCAGASSLLLSLWDVHDQSTAELMQEFYRGYVASGEMVGSLRMPCARSESRTPPLFLGSLRPGRQSRGKRIHLAIPLRARAYIFSLPILPSVVRREDSPLSAGSRRNGKTGERTK